MFPFNVVFSSLTDSVLSNDNCTHTGNTFLNVDIHRYKIIKHFILLVINIIYYFKKVDKYNVTYLIKDNIIYV